MKKYLVKNCVENMLPIFISSGYTQSSVAELKRNIQHIVRFHNDNEKVHFNELLALQYTSNIQNMYAAGQMSKSRKNALVRAVAYVEEFVNTGTIIPGRKILVSRLSIYYNKIMKEIEKSDKWSVSLNRNIQYAAHTYFLYLSQNNIRDISQISSYEIRKYIMHCSDRMTSASLNTIRRNLKHLHHWLYEEGYITSDYADILSFTTPDTHKIKKPIPHSEIAMVLDAIDKSTAIGKRDYAMFLLATVTGLRSIDIASLRFSNIHWINGEIKLCQEKTSATLALPLTTDVGEAIKDYILFGRPNSELENVFLSSHPPFLALGRRGIYSAFNRIRTLIGLPKCPFHGLRRAVGSNMVIAGIPVTTVAQVLGHSNISSTKQYISLDSTHLKECALDLAGILPNRGDAQ